MRGWDDVSGESTRPAMRAPVFRSQEEDDSLDEVQRLPPIGYLASVNLDGYPHPLRLPVKYEIEQEGEYITAFSPALLLYGSGRSLEQAEVALAEAIVGVWKEFESEGLLALHPSAMSQAMKLRRLLGR